MRSEGATDEPATVARPGATDISTMPDDVPQTEGQAQQTTTTSPDSGSIAAANEKTPQEEPKDDDPYNGLSLIHI